MLLLWCAACVVFALWTWRMRTHNDPQVPPYYTGVYPIIGHIFYFIGDSERLWHNIMRWAHECTQKGGAIRFMLAHHSFYVLTDPEDIVTAANACGHKAIVYSWAKSWLGNGLVTASGAIWKRHRQLISPAFNLTLLHGFLSIFNSQSRILVQDLSHEVGKGRFDVTPYLKENALRSFCMTSMGLDSLEDEEFIKKYSKAMDTMLNFWGTKLAKIWLRTKIICKLTGYKQKEEKLIKTLNDFYDITIEKKRAALKNKESVINHSSRGLRNRPLLDLLLEMSSNDALSDEEIRDEVNTFIVAGYDTSSLALAYILNVLGTYQEAQDRMYTEIQTVFGDDDRDLEKTDLSQLTYMEAVINESLRLYPIVPLVSRRADKDVQLKKYRIPAGSEVVLLIYGQNRHPIWGADVNEFRPERWLQPHPGQKSAFGSFGMGKRICLGQSYAMMSMKTTLVHIIRNYRITSDINELRLKYNIVVKPVVGCNIALERRN